mgnify:CR=1 FL=1
MKKLLPLLLISFGLVSSSYAGMQTVTCNETNISHASDQGFDIPTTNTRYNLTMQFVTDFGEVKEILVTTDIGTSRYEVVKSDELGILAIGTPNFSFLLQSLTINLQTGLYARAEITNVAGAVQGMSGKCYK